MDFLGKDLLNSRYARRDLCGDRKRPRDIISMSAVASTDAPAVPCRRMWGHLVSTQQTLGAGVVGMAYVAANSGHRPVGDYEAPPRGIPGI